MFKKTVASLTHSHLDLEHSLLVAQIRKCYSKLQLPLGRPREATLLLAAALEAERLVPGLAHICLFPTYVLLALQVC